MREQVIIGAGLSGLVAAINLAREGYNVLVRERRNEVGGATDLKGLEGKIINIGDGTPLNLERIREYTGIDLTPVAVPLRSCRNHIYGKTFDIDFNKAVPTYLVERGPHPTSIDVYLYNLAVSEGVRFQFNDTVTDFSELPPDSIVATGLFGDAWPTLGVPHLQVFGYLGMSTLEDTSPKVIIYFDEYTRDYAFYSQINGARGACLFSRGKSLDPGVRDRFRRQLEDNDGVSFDEWYSISFGALPVANIRNPRLFAGNLILTGTISGSIDPFLLFGVHGALVSGKVAAITVSDHHGGLKEFARMNRAFPLGYLGSIAYRHMPMWMLKRATWAGISMYPVMGSLLKDHMFGLVPGYMMLQHSGSGLFFKSEAGLNDSRL